MRTWEDDEPRDVRSVSKRMLSYVFRPKAPEYDALLPENVPAAQMTLQEARRGLCWRSGGDVRVCRECRAPCAFGQRVMDLTKEAEE